MPGEGLPPRWNLSGKRLAWAVACVLCAASLILSAFTASSYTEIAKAKVLSYVSTTETAELVFDTGGAVAAVNLTLDFRVVNPSGRELRAWILTYKGWLRDTPMEDGTDMSRWRIDGTLDYTGTVMKYYPVFVTTYALDNPPVTVPAHSEVTVTRWVRVDWQSYPDIMATISQIYNHTVAGGGEPEWLHYTSAILFIQGIPQYVGPSHDANVIRRYEGFDLTPGVGGAGS